MSNNDQRLQVILSVLLAKVTQPAIVLVTAASPRDDSSMLSAGLTKAAKDAGHSAVTIALSDFTGLSFSGRAAVQKDVDQAIAEKSAVHDVVFIDAPSLLDTQFAVHVAKLAAVTVLALANGRKVTPEDERAAELLRMVDAKFLGVVTTPYRPLVVEQKQKKASRVEPSAAVVRVKSSLP
jgi:Mrp family chromosome partitioning ATPase